MIWLSRCLNLYNSPGRRDTPHLNRLPLVRGLCDIRHFELPVADDARLRATVPALAGTFITPTIPNFLPTG